MSTEDYEAFESMLSERLSVIEVDCREARAEGRRALEIKDTVGMQLAKQTLQMKTLERRRVAAMLSVRGTAVWNPGWDSGSARGGGSISANPIPPPPYTHYSSIPLYTHPRFLSNRAHASKRATSSSRATQSRTWTS